MCKGCPGNDEKYAVKLVSQSRMHGGETHRTSSSEKSLKPILSLPSKTKGAQHMNYQRYDQSELKAEEWGGFGCPALPGSKPSPPESQTHRTKTSQVENPRCCRTPLTLSTSELFRRAKNKRLWFLFSIYLSEPKRMSNPISTPQSPSLPPEPSPSPPSSPSTVHLSAHRLSQQQCLFPQRSPPSRFQEPEKTALSSPLPAACTPLARTGSLRTPVPDWVHTPPCNVQPTFPSTRSSPTGVSAGKAASGLGPQQKSSPSCSARSLKVRQRGGEGENQSTSGRPLQRRGCAPGVAAAVSAAATARGGAGGCRARHL